LVATRAREACLERPPPLLVHSARHRAAYSAHRLGARSLERKQVLPEAGCAERVQRGSVWCACSQQRWRWRPLWQQRSAVRRRPVRQHCAGKQRCVRRARRWRRLRWRSAVCSSACRWRWPVRHRAAQRSPIWGSIWLSVRRQHGNGADRL
jgi:hypothetical protein